MKKCIKVVFISSCAGKLFDPLVSQPFGGAELQTYLLAQEFAKNEKYEVVFLVNAPLSGIYDGITVGPIGKPIKKGVPLISRVINKGRFRRAFLRLGKDADLVFQTAAGELTLLTAKTAKKLEMKFHHHIASDADVTKGKLQGGFADDYYGLLSKIDLVTSQNEFQRESLEKNFGVVAPIVFNGFPLPKKKPNVTKDTVLWVASSQNLKQPHLFLSLAKLYPNQHFTMVMPKNDVELWEEISKEASEIKNLTFIENVPSQQIQSLFDQAKVFVNTSTYEGFPNTFVQAGMGATPILSLNVDPSEILANYGMGMCSQGDFDKLIESLKLLTTDTDLSERMGESGFFYVQQHPDIRKIVLQFEKLWHERLGIEV